MANLVTLSRVLLLFLLARLAYLEGSLWQTAALPLMILIFALDGVDGYVARRFKEESLFGAAFDIAADRVVENVLWLVFVDLDLVPVWVAIVCLTRCFIVDAIRAYGAVQGAAPFAMQRSRMGRFLVAGRFMRIFYASVKGVAFGYMLLLLPLSWLAPVFWAAWAPPLLLLKDALVFTAVALCLLRGIPVVTEFCASAGPIFIHPRHRQVSRDPRPG